MAYLVGIPAVSNISRYESVHAKKKV